MKALILTVTAGFGHHATAKAIEDELQSRGVTTKIIDVYKYASKFMYGVVDKGYLVSTKYAPEMYRLAYSSQEHKRISDFNPIMIANMICSSSIEKFTEAFDADVIICTHIFAAQIVDELKIRGKLSVPVIGIITDYTIHPYWNSLKKTEYIVLASELLIPRAIKDGLREETLVTTGIPIRPKFAHKLSRAEACRELGIDEEDRIVLVMAGSMGYGHMSTIVRSVAASVPGDKLTLLAVCGNNKRQYNKLIKENGGKEVNDGVHVYGFADNVDVMMDAADCIVTKPGGLTVSEALAKRLPMLLVTPIPGQEERNIEFLINSGAAVRVTKTFPIDEALHFIFGNPTRLRLMEECIDSIRKPDSTSDLAELAISVGKKYSGEAEE